MRMINEEGEKCFSTQITSENYQTKIFFLNLVSKISFKTTVQSTVD